jgi:dTDP-4-dehydrorhamnose 3,5-epimerase
MYKSIIALPIQVATRTWHHDARGKLAEVLRKDDTVLYQDDFGQVYVTTMRPGIIKAWHRHEKQADRGMVRFGALTVEPNGDYKVCLDYVVSADSPRMLMIPPGVYHGFSNIGTEEAFVMNVSTHVYNPEDPDEFREPYDRFTGFNWKQDFNG